MRALLLAAGLGTRLRPLTDSVPKCLVPVHGRPLLSYWLDLLLPEAIDRVLLNTHHHAGAVESFVAHSRWRERIDIAFERVLLGTGGTVLQNRRWFGNADFMVVHADNLSRFDASAFIQAHAKRPAGTVMTMMTFDTDDPQSCGIVETDSESIVRQFHEKVPNPPGTRANGAVYIFDPVIFDFLSGLGRTFIDISVDVIPACIGRIFTYHNAHYHRDIGTPESLRKAELGYPAQW